MTEDEKKLSEDKKNLNGGKEGVKSTYTAEEVEAIKNKMQSDSEKGVQKIISEKKIFETVLDEVGKIAENKEYLIDLQEKSPEVAKIILDKYYDGQDIEEFKTSIGYKEDITDPEIIKKLIKKQAGEMADSQKINDAKANFIKRLQMSGDELEQFEEAFLERTQLKSFKVNDIEKNLEKAYRENNNDPEMLAKLKNQEIIGRTLATGDGKGGKHSSDKKTSFDKKREEVRAFKAKYKTS